MTYNMVDTNTVKSYQREVQIYSHQTDRWCNMGKKLMKFSRMLLSRENFDVDCIPTRTRENRRESLMSHISSKKREEGLSE